MTEIEAVGADFDPTGNERRLQFVWPIIRLPDGRLYLAEGSDWGPDGPGLRGPVPTDDPERHMSLLTEPLSIEPGQGLMVIGPGYLENMARLSNPVFDALLAVSGSWTRNPEGFAFLATDEQNFQGLARGMAQQARRAFDDLLRDSQARTLSWAARAALEMFESDPTLSYESRIVRRLLALRIDRDWEKYNAALVRAARRLDLAATDVQRLVLESLEILQETMPFERNLRPLARDKFLAMAAEVRAADTHNQLEQDDAVAAIAAVLSERASG